MQITIDNKDFNFQMDGTVGVAHAVGKITGEPFNMFGMRDSKGNWIKQPNDDHAIWAMVLLLKWSNPEKEEDITYDWFLQHLTSAIQKQLMNYVVRRWAELEGIHVPEDNEEEPDPNVTTQQNATKSAAVKEGSRKKSSKG